MKEIVFRETGLESVNEVTAFLGLKDPSFWNYEYNSYLPQHAVFLAGFVDNQVVGTQAFMPYRLNINGKTVLTGRSERTLLHQKYRGSDNFKALMDSAIRLGQCRGMELVWGSTLAKKAFERVGFSFVTGFFEHAITVVSYKEAIRKIFSERDKKKLSAQIAALIASPVLRLIGSTVNALCGRKPPIDILEKQHSTEDVSALYSRMRGDDDFITISQDEHFIAWAYERGNRAYRRYYGYRGEELLAYFVIDVTDEKEAFLVDFAAIDFAAFYEVWSEIFDQLRHAGTAYIRVAYNYKNRLLAIASRWLIFMGFVPFFRRGGFVVRNINFRHPGLLDDLSLWYITPIWIALHKQ